MTIWKPRGVRRRGRRRGFVVSSAVETKSIGRHSEEGTQTDQPKQKDQTLKQE